LVEKLRAGGVGIVVFYIFIGVGTQIVEGGLFWCYNGDGSIVEVFLVKEVCEFIMGGCICEFVFEEVIIIDFVLVCVVVGDCYGNFVFYELVCNFNLIVVMVGWVIIVEVEWFVKLGEIDFDYIYLFGVFV